MANNYLSKPAKKKTATKTSSAKIRVTLPKKPTKPDPTAQLDWEYCDSWSENQALAEYFQKLDYAVFHTEIAVYKKHGAEVEYEDYGQQEFYMENIRTGNMTIIEVANMLLDLHKSIEQAVPALPGTFTASIICDFGINISASCKINKPLDVVAAEMEQYNKKLALYEKALDEYNSPASVAARSKQVTAAQKKELEKQKKIDKLQKELDKLKKVS